MADSFTLPLRSSEPSGIRERNAELGWFPERVAVRLRMASMGTRAADSADRSLNQPVDTFLRLIFRLRVPASRVAATGGTHRDLTPSRRTDVSAASEPRNARYASDRVDAAFAGPDADNLFHRHHEDLAVSDPPGARRALDRLDHLGRKLVRHDYLKLHLR